MLLNPDPYGIPNTDPVTGQPNEYGFESTTVFLRIESDHMGEIYKLP
jgi:hypothetical protein